MNSMTAHIKTAYCCQTVAKLSTALNNIYLSVTGYYYDYYYYYYYYYYKNYAKTYSDLQVLRK